MDDHTDHGVAQDRTILQVGKDTVLTLPFFSLHGIAHIYLCLR